jgi:dihydrofolate synthase/folylpolyglutamate synthase
MANAVTAAVLLDELDALGLRVPAAAVEAGLTTARWPGRLEIVRWPLGAVLLDGAHNPGGARALAAYLEEAHPGGLPIVFGAMKDKDTPAMLAALGPVATSFALTAARNPRALAPATLAAQAAAAAPAVPCAAFDDFGEAVAWAAARGPAVCVGGSIFLVGDVREWLLARGGAER